MTYRCQNLTPAGGSPESQRKRTKNGHPLGYPISERVEIVICNPCIYCGAQALILRGHIRRDGNRESSNSLSEAKA